MNTKQTDILNIFLILLSLTLAFILPFELFLFSYAVLGPLHYLTEINWLNGKKYFISRPKWIWVFVIFSILVSIPVIFRLPAFSGINNNDFLQDLFEKITAHFGFIICLSLLFAAGLVFLKKQGQIVLFFLAGMLVCFGVLKFIPASLLIAGIFIPTIIHVYVFTLLFMIFGTLNNKSSAGIAAIILLIASPLIIFFITVNPAAYHINETVKAVFFASGLQRMTDYLARFFGAMHNGSPDLLSIAGIKIQIFIAFSYTYHYLNWFSKTTVIGWNKNVSKPKLLAIVFMWVASVLLYWFNYKTGLMALFFLSYLHVLLEFPLNITSVKGIWNKLSINR